MHNILGWIKKWESLKIDATFDPTAELAKLDAAETINQGILAKYNHWVGYGAHFTERLENWKKDDGKYFSEEAVKIYLQSIKDSLESVGRGLDPVEQNELDQFTYYIENGEVPTEKRILPMDLKAALGVKINVFSSLVQKWINYSQNIDFKVKTDEIKNLANKVNAPGAKVKPSEIVKYCKETLTKRPELVEDNDICDLPDVKDKDRDWLDWFFTRDPEVVVETIALQELKVDSNLKTQILNEMKDYKDSKDKLILLNRTVYGDGQEFTEEGIIKYYAEKLGGQNHAMKKYEKPFKDQQSPEPFWTWKNPAAILSGLVWAFLQRKKIATWWNSPVELEEEDDEEDDD